MGVLMMMMAISFPLLGPANWSASHAIRRSRKEMAGQWAVESQSEKLIQVPARYVDHHIIYFEIFNWNVLWIVHRRNRRIQRVCCACEEEYGMCIGGILQFGRKIVIFIKLLCNNRHNIIVVGRKYLSGSTNRDMFFVVGFAFGPVPPIFKQRVAVSKLKLQFFTEKCRWSQNIATTELIANEMVNCDPISIKDYLRGFQVLLLRGDFHQQR